MSIERLLGSAPHAFAITAGATELESPIRGLYVGTTGNVQVQMQSGTTVTFNNLTAGVIHPIRCTHVLDAGGATGIVGVT